MERTLSIFIDESGDFGFKKGSSEYYLLTFVFHEQDKDISKQLNKIKNLPYFHGGPLIRKENEYINAPIEERQKIFTLFSGFVSSLPIKTKTFHWIKKDFNNDIYKMESRMARDINAFFIYNYEYFISFTNIIYYDKGQSPITRLLNICFAQSFFKYTFKEGVKAESYRLFQVADFVSTIRLYEQKIESNNITNSEKIFINLRNFKKIYLKMINKKEFK